MELLAMCCTTVPQDFKMFEKTIFMGITESAFEGGSVNFFLQQSVKPIYVKRKSTCHQTSRCYSASLFHELLTLRHA